MRSKVGPKKLGEMSVIIYSQNLRGMSDSKFRRILHVTVLIMPLIVVAERYCCLLGAP